MKLANTLVNWSIRCRGYLQKLGVAHFDEKVPRGKRNFEAPPRAPTEWRNKAANKLLVNGISPAKNILVLPPLLKRADEGVGSG